MNISEIKNRVDELSTELGGIKNAGLIMGGINPPAIEKALNAEDSRTLNIMSNFFESRDYAFEIYTEEQIQLIKGLELAIIDEGSATNLAQKLDMSSTTLSNIRKGKYSGAIDDKFEDIKNYLELRDEKSNTYISNQYIPTYTSQKIYEHIRTAHVQGGCVMITGDAGIGKTETIKEYKRKNPNRTIVLEPIHLNTSELDMLELLADELGIDINGVKPSRLYKKILSELYSGLIIIVDEVQKLTFRAVDTLRGYSDIFKSKGESLGIAFIGNDIFRQQFYGKRGIGKEQVWNRCIERPKFESKKYPFQ
ncbi:MAG: ATP-binding protein [Ruminococcus sp.]|nr:ATP-binding protein [Ruminococcus sp.]